MSNDESANPYRAPASDVATPASDNLWETFIGPQNTRYYLDRFERFESGGSKLSWNWPAFFISSWWVLYRKMWLWAALLWLVLPFAASMLSGALTYVIDPTVALIAYYGVYAIVAFILFPLFANWLYYQRAVSKIARATGSHSSAGAQAEAVARAGGTSTIWIWILLGIFVLGILAAILIPAYQDYALRQ